MRTLIRPPQGCVAHFDLLSFVIKLVASFTEKLLFITAQPKFRLADEVVLSIFAKSDLSVVFSEGSSNKI